MRDHDFIRATTDVKPYVVQIFTPTTVGTGFLFAQSKDHKMVGVATAAHVINQAHRWEQPIEIKHHTSGKTIMLRVPDRVILLDQRMDTAAILFDKIDIPFQESDPILAPEGKSLKIAMEIAWIGFPAISPDDLCLFSGRISAFIEAQRAYLVDGVAINGVSGGPAFWPGTESTKETHVIGVVSAYAPNRATGEPLPGLSIIRDVTQLQSVIKKFRSLDEAKEKESQTPPIVNPPPDLPQKKDNKDNSQQTP
jgi:hypothetical protein